MLPDKNLPFFGWLMNMNVKYFVFWAKNILLIVVFIVWKYRQHTKITFPVRSKTEYYYLYDNAVA